MIICSINDLNESRKSSEQWPKFEIQKSIVKRQDSSTEKENKCWKDMDQATLFKVNNKYWLHFSHIFAHVWIHTSIHMCDKYICVCMCVYCKIYKKDVLTNPRGKNIPNIPKPSFVPLTRWSPSHCEKISDSLRRKP